jgi:hypothetical protein
MPGTPGYLRTGRNSAGEKGCGPGFPAFRPSGLQPSQETVRPGAVHNRDEGAIRPKQRTDMMGS